MYSSFSVLNLRVHKEMLYFRKERHTYSYLNAMFLVLIIFNTANNCIIFQQLYFHIFFSLIAVFFNVIFIWMELDPHWTADIHTPFFYLLTSHRHSFFCLNILSCIAVKIDHKFSIYALRNLVIMESIPEETLLAHL